VSAILSPLGLHRYRLERDIQSNPDLWPAAGGTFCGGLTIAFFGINPSTADATINDPTVRKWIGFCERWGARRFIVGNAFAWRSKAVRDLSQQPDAIGPDNDYHLTAIARDADLLVPCWGSRDKLPGWMQPRLGDVLDLLRASGKPLMCFGTTAGGDPLHPLYLPYHTPLRPLEA